MKLRISTVRTRLRLPQPTRSGRKRMIGISRRTGSPQYLVQGQGRGELRATFAFDVAAVGRHGHVEADLAEAVPSAARDPHHLVLITEHAAAQGEHPE